MKLTDHVTYLTVLYFLTSVTRTMADMRSANSVSPQQQQTFSFISRGSLKKNLRQNSCYIYYYIIFLYSKAIHSNNIAKYISLFPTVIIAFGFLINIFTVQSYLLNLLVLSLLVDAHETVICIIILSHIELDYEEYLFKPFLAIST